ncbi:hypothetical protein PINS_up013437 [Pythium insidiosum]|nr:hypothetical protein PINS_up013437 [Pythium insidiosum]
MRDEGVTYHRMKRYFCRCVGVNFFRYSTRESANTIIDAVFGAEIERIEEWDGRGLLHLYRHSFKIHFTNGVVFNADADSEDDKNAWTEYMDRAIRGAAAVASTWQDASATDSSLFSDISILSRGGLAFADKKTAKSNPKFKNLPTCGHPTCSARFESAGKRQHHCRNCGASVCSDHSSRFAVLRHFQMNDAVRLCMQCFRAQRFVAWMSMLVQRTSMAHVQRVPLPELGPDEQKEVDALLDLLNDSLVGTSDVIQVLHLHRHGSDEAYLHAIKKLLELASESLTDFEFFLPQIFHMWFSMDWSANCVKAAMLFRVISFAARVHMRFATALYWLARAAVDDACGWGFGQSELAIPSYLYRKLSMCKLLMVNLEMQIYQDEWVFQTDNDLAASDVQTQIIRCLFSRVIAVVCNEATIQDDSMHLGYVCEALSLAVLPHEYVSELNHAMIGMLPGEESASENRRIFRTQLDFIQQLCDLTERLRKIEPHERKKALKAELATIELPDNAFCPLGSCEDSMLRFASIVQEEGTVFTTKARAPTLIWFEVERLDSSANTNTWLQRACGNAFDESIMVGSAMEIAEEGTTTDQDSDDDMSLRNLMSSRRSITMNAIEMATSSDIAQVLPPDALGDDGGDDRISEAFKAHQQRKMDMAEEDKAPVDSKANENVPLENEEDADEADHEESRDQVKLDSPPRFSSFSRESSISRRRSGSLMTMSAKSLDSLLAACAETFAKRSRSISEGNEMDIESHTRTAPLLNDFEKFTMDQLTTMAQNLEMSLLSENPAARGVFTGHDVLEWMTKNEIVSDEAHARWLAEELLRGGVIECVTNSDGQSKAATKLVFSNDVTYRLGVDASMLHASGVTRHRRTTSSSAPVTRTPKSRQAAKSFPHTPPPLSKPSSTPSQSRLVSPRKKGGVDTNNIVDAVGASFPTSIAANGEAHRSSHRRDSSTGGSPDDQRSVTSTSNTLPWIDRFRPEVTSSALETIDSALDQYVFSQPTIENTEEIRESIRALREQLEIVTEHVLERRRRRHVAVESAFGESFEEKKERLRKSSRNLRLCQSSEWDCVAFIVKSNDDLRQEVLCLQLIRQIQDIFQAAELPLRLLPYRIVATSASTGMIEFIKNATSLDSLKKRPGYTTLANHFIKTYGGTESEAYKVAMANFVRSMAAYSLACYFLQIKDRHNGNIMIDSEGHVVHIDFGFILGIAPGGRFSLETAPFKLTSEMVEAMGGTQSEYFKAYVILLIQGFLALQQHADTVLLMIAIMAQESSCPCFLSQNPRDVLSITKDLFKLDFNQNQVIKHVLRLVRRSHNSYRTRQYDMFQKLTNGILP